MKKDIAAFDADEVVLECRNFLLQAARTAYPDRNISVVCQDYDLDKRFGIPKSDVDKIWQIFEETVHNQTPFEGVSGVLQDIKNKGCSIVIVTAIPQKMVAQRIAVFKKHGLAMDKLIATGANGDKRKALEDLAPMLFVDDRLKNLKSAQGLGIHRVWIEQSGEIQELDPHPELFEEKHSSVVDWYTHTKFFNS